MIWKDDKGKFTKKPLDPHNGRGARTNDPSTWGSFDQALDLALRRRLGGVGYVFGDGDPYCGIDLDDATNGNGSWKSETLDIIDELNSYTERSPSGKGCHIIGRGVLPAGKRRRGTIEMYDSGRFFTVTGMVDGPGTLRDFQSELNIFHTRIFDTKNQTRYESRRDFNRIPHPALSDAEVIDRAFHDEKRGEKFTLLWKGAWRDLGYPSQSEADLALCNELAWWVNYDPVRIDALFRRSGLFRPDKWDKPHHADGRTYGQGTVGLAVEGHTTRDGYEPERSSSREPNASLGGKIVIAVNRQLKEVEADAWNLIHTINSQTGGPILFQKAGKIVEISQEDGVPPYITPLSKEALTSTLYNNAEWVLWGEKSYRPSKPPKEVVAGMLCRPQSKLPRLEGVNTFPFLSSDGRLISSDGYHPRDFIWLKMGEDLKGLSVRDRSMASDVQWAVDFILGELLVDFPFADQSDRAHALAAFLLPFVRPLIRGPTPLHLIEAPTPGSGKTLLANLIALVAMGEDIPAQAMPNDEEEMRKRLTTIMRHSPVMVLFDNVTQKTRIDSGALSAIITTSDWSDRLLGVNEDIHSINRSIWMVTANNPRMSMEIARRTIRIRLDPHVEEPWEREGFRHPEITAWTREHRRDLVEALLTIILGWIAAGRPFEGQRLGTFEHWTTVIGGILQHAGIGGFLANRKELYKQVDDESTSWKDFIEEWWRAFQNTAVQVKQLNDLCETNDLLNKLRGEGSSRSQATKLGTALRRMRDSVKSGYRIHVDVGLKNPSGNYRNNGYRLTKADECEIGSALSESIQNLKLELDPQAAEEEMPF